MVSILVAGGGCASSVHQPYDPEVGVTWLGGGSLLLKTYVSFEAKARSSNVAARALAEAASEQCNGPFLFDGPKYESDLIALHGTGGGTYYSATVKCGMASK
jgi:hypothetical protein